MNALLKLAACMWVQNTALRACELLTESALPPGCPRSTAVLAALPTGGGDGLSVDVVTGGCEFGADAVSVGSPLRLQLAGGHSLQPCLS